MTPLLFSLVVLAASYAAACVVVAGLIGIGIVFGGRIKKQVFEEEVQVKFVAPEQTRQDSAVPDWL